MIVEFKVKNFRSIKEEQVLSMVKATGTELEHTHTFVPVDVMKAPSLVRTATIYGANAAGKSNIIRALEVMQQIVIESGTKIQRGDKLPLTPFLLDPATKNEPSEFEVTFIHDKVRYQYGFVADVNRIYEEWLIAFPVGHSQHWFSRVYNHKNGKYDWDFGAKLTGSKQVWQEATRENALFLSTAIQLNSEKLQPVYDWFKEELHISRNHGWEPSFTFSLCKTEKYKSKVMEFLKTADFDIEDINVVDKDFDVNEIPKDIPESLREEILTRFKGKKMMEVASIHLDLEGTPFEFDINDDESDGTQKFLSFIGPWIDALENGYVLVVDELHDNLHPLMVRFLIDFFHNNNTNPKNAQLIFTSHETSVMNQEVFRRDQIWFCEKKNKATTLYSLSDFSPRKGVEDVEKGYFSGRYGALPYLKSVTDAMGVEDGVEKTNS